MPTKNKPTTAIELLNEAAGYERVAFEINDSVSGADLVQWFAGWRKRVKHILGRDERELNGMRLSDTELAVVLSALRYFQANIDDIRVLNREAPLEHFKAGFTFPTAKQIDRLCERINQ